MNASRKEARWQEVSEWVTRVIDGIGCPVDDGIRAVVVALRVLGINTLASCEGHLDHGCAAPWVDVGASDVRPLTKVAHLKQQEVEQARAQGVPVEERVKLNEVVHEARLVVKRLHMEERLKLMHYLDLFYGQHHTSHDQHLIIAPYNWMGTGRLESQGADCQDCRTLEERTQKLSLYQQEMQAFAAFLQEFYFGAERDEHIPIS